MKKILYLLVFFFLFISLLSGRGTYIEKNNLLTNEKPVLAEMVVELEKENTEIKKQLSKATNQIQRKDRRITWLKTNRGFGRGVVFVFIFGGIGFILFIIMKIITKVF